MPRAVVTSAVCAWVVVFLVLTIGYGALRDGIATELHALSVRGVAPFVGIGFAAEIIDGALGMGYGIISSVLLVGSGLPPAMASMSVHTAETFTTAASGISHIRQGNVDWRLFMRLVLPGVIGGVLGAVAIAFAPVNVARPVVFAYLAIVGLLLIARSASRAFKPATPRVVGLLGLCGGFFDASGGGGWGPIVTGSMLLQGVDPRGVVGTINLAEFFVTAVIAIAFTLAIGVPPISVATVGLLVGGLIAAPVAAGFTRRIRPRPLMLAIGVLLSAISAYDLFVTLG